MYFSFQLQSLFGSRSSLTALLLGFFVFSLGCASQAELSAHQAKVDALRARLPYVTQIGQTRSMETVINPGSLQMVRPLPYNQLQSGRPAVFWPLGWPFPVCHFVGRRIGTDSWDTHGMNQESDLTNGLGFLLTRDNYIGVIW